MPITRPISRHHPVKSSPFAEYAQAIGWLCMRWTFLEVMVDQLVVALLALDDEDIGRCVTSNIDLRDKFQIALSVGYIKRIDDQWFEELKTVINTADNELREKRNRYAHDLWTFDKSNAMKKIYFRTKMQKSQSRKPIELSTLQETEVLPEEIWATADAIGETAGEIALLWSQHTGVTRRRALQKK
jgi:hypothetical protein